MFWLLRALVLNLQEMHIRLQYGYCITQLTVHIIIVATPYTFLHLIATSMYSELSYCITALTWAWIMHGILVTLLSVYHYC